MYFALEQETNQNGKKPTRIKRSNMKLEQT